MPTRNIRLTIQYDGTHYSGWQSQKNARSIQDVLTDALKKITGGKVNLTGSGRTDAGVHARAQVANFKTRSDIPLKKLLLGLNSILPDDIVVSAVKEAGLKFDAQRAAKSKLYRYTLINSNVIDPFIRRFAAKCFYKLDILRMRRAAKPLMGKRDFRSFRAAGGGEKDTVRRIRNIKIEKYGDMIYIDMEADGFLYNMARNIVGTLIEVGRGKLKADAVKGILAKKDRRFCGPTAPAKGLCLLKVRY